MQDEDLTRQIREVEATLVMNEYDFPSRVPVIGPLIHFTRVLWNSISARWYVQHYVRQQAAVNSAMVKALWMFYQRDRELGETLHQQMVANQLNLQAVTELKETLDQINHLLEKRGEYKLQEIEETVRKVGQTLQDEGRMNQRLTEYIVEQRNWLEHDTAIIVQQLLALGQGSR